MDDRRIEGIEVMLHAIDLTIADVRARDEQLATLTLMRDAFEQRKGKDEPH